MKTTKTIKSGIGYRSFEIRAADVKEDRTVELAFSSEAPVETYNWDVGRCFEILDHGKDSVDMTRLRSGAALLVEHHRDDQVGVVESATIGADKVGRATVRFGASARAEEIFQDVKAGIRRLVSVGYRVREWMTEKVEDGGMKTLRATRWEPMEISIVSVPADVSVGVGRSERREEFTTTITEESESDMKIRALLDRAATDGGGGTTAAAAPAADVNLAATAAQKRTEEIMDMRKVAQQHKVPDEMFDKALERGDTGHKFRADVLEFIRNKPQPETSFREVDSGRAAKTLGELVTGNESYRTAVKSGLRNKNFGFDVPGLGIRTTFINSTGGPLTSYDRPPGLVLLEQQPLTIAQLFSSGETSALVIRFLREEAYSQAATAVAEAAAKPEAEFSLEEVDATVKKIAVIGRVSDEMFNDFPVVRDYINQRLVFMVGSLEDNHLLNGDGTNNKITGVLSTSGIQTEASGASATVIDALHKAITKIRTVGFFSPDAIVMHPNDWQDVKLSKDSNGQYYAGGPFTGAYAVGGYQAAGQIWGLPVIATTAIAEGTALIGAFKLGGQIFRREGIRVEMTNSDASDFQYNRICIRVEERLTLAVYRPKAFCTVTGIA